MESQWSKLVGRQVIVIGPAFFAEDKLQPVKLVAVEDAGIWIDSAEVMDALVTRYRVKPEAPGMAFFVPFGEIRTVLASLEG